GPKKVKKLYNELKIKDIDDLKKALKKEKIREIEGFGKKTEKSIIQSIKQYEKSQDRMLINRAMETAEDIIKIIKDKAKVKKIDYAGSLRRWKETIGDIDILAVAKDSKKIMEAFTKMKDVDNVMLKGDTKSTVMLKGGIHVDLRVLPESSYGAAMQYFTGSKDHNIALRKIAIKKGYKLSEYGIYSKKSGRKLGGKTESEIYKKVGLKLVPPELRENRGEIEAAKKKKLPSLVELDDIRGDLQMHTSYSDGDNTVKEMADAAAEKGYDYIAITDHSKSERIANGMSERQIKKQWKEIEKAEKKTDIRILRGAEVDILKDGSLDYPDKILKELDIVLGAVHSGFKSSEKETTDRIKKAFENKHLTILAHPTGRMIGKRVGYKVNLDKMYEAAEDNGIILEINADPARLDLNDSHIINAKEYKVKFSLGTDAHSTSGLDNMRYGVGQARRGWLEKKDVINTKTWKQLQKLL
ncbi:DNA polymerase/3'-5' exonuclease PolX, partial [Candidatus Woesearchaeota archaeon]|nr:DNA polymerase/3'-5' exonuclease PolX [Candidatus Woesearchaeota archaeon]